MLITNVRNVGRWGCPLQGKLPLKDGLPLTDVCGRYTNYKNQGHWKKVGAALYKGPTTRVGRMVFCLGGLGKCGSILLFQWEIRPVGRSKGRGVHLSFKKYVSLRVLGCKMVLFYNILSKFMLKECSTF